MRSRRKSSSRPPSSRHGGRTARRRRSQQLSCVHDGNAGPLPVRLLPLFVASHMTTPQLCVTANHVHELGITEADMAFESIMYQADLSGKLLSMTSGKGRLDFLLSSTEDCINTANLIEAKISVPVHSEMVSSSASMPSMDDTFTHCHETLPPSRSQRPGPLRRAQSRSTINATNALHDHPLSSLDMDIEELDFRVFNSTNEQGPTRLQSAVGGVPRRSAFKANIIASLKALRYAARSLTSFASPPLMPGDFLTRSIVTIDPPVPFTDERRPRLDNDHPPAALRRYLNPTNFAQMSEPMKCTTSIQMQTYRVSRGVQLAAHDLPMVLPPNPSHVVMEGCNGSVARQRDMRENGDFIRIAILEMAMRRNGKLDEQAPGRAKWALPPRKSTSRTYKVGADGVPIRWVAQTH